MTIRVKICGITTPADAEAAVRLGANALGLNFYERSPRHVSLERAAEVLAVVPPDIETVAVMVDPTAALVCAAIERLGITTIQLHGDSNDAILPALRRLQAAVIVP